MTDDRGDVLVAVEQPEHVTQLVRTAGDLARAAGVNVRLVTVVVKPHESPFGVFDDATIRRNFAGDSRELLDRARPPAGVHVERDLVVARSVAKGLLTAIEETAPTALVVGWQGPTSRVDALLGTTLDTLVARAPCDLYIERVGSPADGIDSLVVPVAGGPHVQTAARITAAIAGANDARVVVLSVAAAEVDTDQAASFAAAGASAVEAAATTDLVVETLVVADRPVEATVVDQATDHDVVVLGATRQGALRTRLVGSVPRRVADRVDATVVLARSRQTVTGITGRLGGLLGRW